jgi:hypothetical protein
MVWYNTHPGLNGPGFFMHFPGVGRLAGGVRHLGGAVLRRAAM